MSDKNPNIGALSEPIVIQFYYSEKSTSGEEKKVWTDYINVKAAVKQTSADENEDNNQLSGADAIDFTVRSHNGLNRRMRVLWNNQTYQIKGILQISRRYQVLKTQMVGDPIIEVAPGYVDQQRVNYYPE